MDSPIMTMEETMGRMFQQYDADKKGELSKYEVQALHERLRIGGLSLKQVEASMKYVCVVYDACLPSELYGLLKEMDRRYFLVADLRWEFSLMDINGTDTITEEQAKWFMQCVHGQHFSLKSWSTLLKSRPAPGTGVTFSEIEVDLCNIPSAQAIAMEEEEAKRQEERRAQQLKAAKAEEARLKKELLLAKKKREDAKKKAAEEKRKEEARQKAAQIADHSDDIIVEQPVEMVVEQPVETVVEQPVETVVKQTTQPQLSEQEKLAREKRLREEEENRVKEEKEKLERLKREAEEKKEWDAKEAENIEHQLKEAADEEEKAAKDLQAAQEAADSAQDAKAKKEAEERAARAAQKQKEAGEKRIRSNLKGAIKDRKKPRLKTSSTDFRQAKLHDYDEDLPKADRLIKLCDTTEDLKNAMKNRSIPKLESAMQAVRKGGFEPELQPEMIEANLLLLRLRRLERIRAEILELKQSTVAEIRSYQKPPPAVPLVMTSVFLILGHKESETKVWKNIQALVGKTGKESLKRRCLEYDPSKLSLSIATRAQEVLQGLLLDDIREVSAGAATFFLWANNIIEEAKETGS